MSKDGVLMIEIVVQNDDKRGTERKVLLKGTSALHLQGHLGDTVREYNMRTIHLVSLSCPFVADGCSIGLQPE
jgi:hypothetical protein